MLPAPLAFYREEVDRDLNPRSLVRPAPRTNQYSDRSVLVRVVLSVIHHILSEYLLLNIDVILDRASEVWVVNRVRAVGQGG